MKTVSALVSAVALLVPLSLAADPSAATLSVDFELVRNVERCEVVVTITNTSDRDMTIEHSGNRYALAFLVMDEQGNVVKPTGIAKVDRARHEDIVLKPGESFEHTVAASAGDKHLFQFLTGSALFGYELEFGRTYRVVAVYRPEGKDGEGICSAEHVIEFEAHLHEVRI